MTTRLLAFGELRRMRGRFALLAGAVGVLTFLVVLQQAFLVGLVEQFNGGMRSSDADLYVLGDAAHGALPASTVPGDAVGIAEAVAGVDAAGSVRFGGATVLVDGVDADVVLVGLDPGGPGWPADVVAGRAAELDTEVVASADDTGLGFALGVTVRIQPRGLPVEVVGVGGDANLSVTPTLYVPTTTFIAVARDQRPGALTTPRRTAVAVRLAEGANATAVAAALEEAIGGVEVLTRAEVARRFPGVAEVTQSFGIVLALLGVVVALVAGLFFLIVTVQRIPTLTLLRAVGLRTRTLVAALLVQVAVVVCAGVAAGVALATGLLRGVDAGFDLRLDPGATVMAASAILVLALIAALAAVRRVAKVDPAAALAGIGGASGLGGVPARGPR